MDHMNERIIEPLSEIQVNELDEILLNTQEQCQMMEQMIKNQIKVKDEMIDKLYKELEYYKQEQAERFVNQVMKALIKVHKDMKKQISSDKWTKVSVEDMQREYTYIFEDITDLLEQQNIDSFESEQGEIFDGSKHQVFKLEHTDDELLDKKIKKSVSNGYIKGDKVLIPERVIVYQFKEHEGGK